ncbi:MAG: phosphate ABC transporter substrate-binding/OmpA family protein [Paracoccaceae bacterium]
MKQRTSLLLTTAAMTLTATFAQAQNEGSSSAFGSVVETPSVVLTDNSSAESKSGQLLGVEDGFYILLTEDVGTIRVPSDAVTCEGTGCPFSESETAAAAPAAVEDANTDAAVDLSDARVSFIGSDTVGLKLMPAMMEDYAASLNADIDTTVLSKEDTYVRYLGADGSEVGSIFVKSTGSSEAFEGLAAAAADFGMASRAARDSEVAEIVRNGGLRGTDNETVIAMDSIAVATHPDNPVTALRLDQIAAIYQGEITNWSEVGGIDAPINVVSRDGGSTRRLFEGTIFDGEERELGENVLEIEGDHPEMAAAVRDDPNAIGYVSAVFAEGLGNVALTSSCGITSSATAFDIKTEQYPLVRRLYLYNRAEALSEDATSFLNYAKSPAVDDAIERSDFVSFAVERVAQTVSDVDVAIDRVPTAADTQLINQMTDAKALWDRLSTTIRFPSGTTVLGNKELNDLQRLISYLEDLPTGTRVALVGFADNVGNFDNNVRLAGRRAVTVENQIASLAGSRLQNIAFENRAYGELSPSACNTDANGRAINRRVEIWVRK